MEFHQPHAAKTWREFFIELGTIVAGIVIALALEQAVEWLHWQGEVRSARAALKTEIANNDIWFARRIAIAPCIDRQVQEAGRILADLEAGRRPGSFTNFHPTLGGMLNDSEWQSHRAAQTLTHFPSEELALMSVYYDILPRFLDWGDLQGDAGRELSVLQNPPANMTVSDLLRLRKALMTEKDFEALIVLRAPYMLRFAGQLGVPPPPPEPEFVKKFCTLNAADFNRLVRTQDLRP